LAFVFNVLKNIFKTENFSNPIIIAITSHNYCVEYTFTLSVAQYQSLAALNKGRCFSLDLVDRS